MSDEHHKNPWGDNPWSGDKGKKPSTGRGSEEESLDETLQRLQDKFWKKVNEGREKGKTRPGSTGGPLLPTPGKMGVMGLAALLGILWLGSGFFRVQENEMAVVMRFGKLVRHAAPGLQYHLPYPIEVVIKQDPTIRIFEENSRRDSSTSPTMILTNDENMVICNYRVRWRIKDITDYLFRARHPETTIRAAAESVVREVIGQSIAQHALTTDQANIASRVQTSLQTLMDQYKLGVEIVEFNMLGVLPPDEVVNSFNSLQASKTQAEREVNRAQSYSNDIIPRAEGEAFKLIQQSQGERDAAIAKAKGEAERIKQLREAYHKQKDIALKRLYLETMRDVISKANVMIFDQKATQGTIPYLPLHALSKKSKGQGEVAPLQQGDVK